jgi:hypothetical protein
MDRVWLNSEADVEWSGVARGEGLVREAFEALVGPMPAFESFSFGAVFDRVCAELTKRKPAIRIEQGSGALPESMRADRCRAAARAGGESRAREIER